MLQVKANSVKQEFEKQDELKRSAMRAVAALLTIPEAEKSPLMSEFQSQIDHQFQKKTEEFRKECWGEFPLPLMPV